MLGGNDMQAIIGRLHNDKIATVGHGFVALFLGGEG